MNHLIRLKTPAPLFLILLLLACFALSRAAQAVLPSPAPDGGYSGANTAEGHGALFSLTTGGNNTALGAGALNSLTTASQNTATGVQALTHNTASGNTADGFQALVANTTGDENVASGWRALFQNTVGVGNTAAGYQALYRNLDGFDNVADGTFALLSNTHGIQNTACGVQALQFNTNGSNNTAIGDTALFNNTTGSDNVALGISAGFAQTTGSGNVYIGVNVNGVAGESNNCYIDSIFGRPVSPASGAAVFVDSNNKLGTLVSSKRFKEDIKPMDKASEALFSMKPVSFRYTKEIDPKGISQLGLVAEDVEKVNPNLVVRDKEGKPYSVRYDQVNAMLLNEFLKEHSKVKEQEATIAQLKKDFGVTVAQLTARLDEQASQIQKVTAQLEASKTAPQVVNNP